VARERRVAVERGAPFAAELQAAKQLAENPSALAPLETAAANGVPTAPVLDQNLSKLAPAMLKAASAPRHEASVIERLQASAERLGRIRPIPEGPRPRRGGRAAGAAPGGGRRARRKRRRGATLGARSPISRGCPSRCVRRPPPGSRPPRRASLRSTRPRSSRRTRSKRSPGRPNE